MFMYLYIYVFVYLCVQNCLEYCQQYACQSWFPQKHQDNIKSHAKSFGISTVRISHIVQDSPAGEGNAIRRTLKQVPVGQQCYLQALRVLETSLRSVHNPTNEIKNATINSFIFNYFRKMQNAAEFQNHFRALHLRQIGKKQQETKYQSQSKREQNHTLYYKE